METKKPSLRLPKQILVLLFCVLALWWATLYFTYNSSLEYQNLIWAAVYQATALWGAIWGFLICRSWGGSKSILGRAILILGIGLLFQNFGQTVFSIYNLVLKVAVPYPSLADIGFFGSIPFYIYGTFLIGRVCGARLSLKSYHNKAFALIIPIAILVSSYLLFLRGYAVDPSSPLKTFLDFGYPLGQAIYISLAILALIFSKNFLGGIMKRTILMILGALILQYVADFNFLTQAGNGSWINGGYGDFLYLIAYTAMAFSLIQFGSVFSKIQSAA